ncbi:hypothetical protein SDC9_108580 [bioreactor metagenome]|uniref:Uncharacterized protein n=1 Tax=bioreactor metagenome TaxID=1076179 RepID=A0A645B8E9_9ZZZZ
MALEGGNAVLEIEFHSLGSQVLLHLCCQIVVDDVHHLLECFHY